MPIAILDDNIHFPSPSEATSEGLLAIGGDLNPERLLEAYKNGIFPWYGKEHPILWWSPDPRMILLPENFKTSKSLRRLINKHKFRIRFDHDFKSVIHHCATIPREGQGHTWITEEMGEAYITLHQMGYAHSVEAYYDRKLAGGLYGVSLGKAFFGESMFFLITDASKVALYYLVERLKCWNFKLIDAQIETSHLASFGANPIPRSEFLDLLHKAVKEPSVIGSWERSDE